VTTRAPVRSTVRRPWARVALSALELFVGLSAVMGGLQLVRTGFGMPAGWLAHTPFTSWVVPGVLLLAAVALPHLVAFALTVADHPRAAVASALVGAALIGWIGVQILVLRRYFFLQPLIASLGAAELALALAWVRSGRRTSG
jgi:hypothetical protein